MRRKKKAKLNYIALLAMLAGLFAILYAIVLSSSAYLQKAEIYAEREHDYIVSLAASPVILAGAGVMLFAIGLVFLRGSIYEIKKA